MARAALYVAVILGLAACETVTVVDTPAEPDACGALSLQSLVGRPLSAFDPALAKGPLRVIAPNTPVTMDYHPKRLNVTHSKFRIIQTITCG